MSTPVDARLPTAPSLVPPLNLGANPAPAPMPSVGAATARTQANIDLLAMVYPGTSMTAAATTVATTTITTTTTSTAITTTTTTNSAPAVSTTTVDDRAGVEAGAAELPKRAKKKTFRRSKSLERIAAFESNLEKISLPGHVMELNRQIERLVRAETRDFTIIGTRKDCLALYRIRPGEVLQDFQQLWQALMSVLAVRLSPLFAQAIATAESMPQWEGLLDKLGQQEAVEHGSGQRDEIRALAATCFKPLLDAVSGDGRSFLTSILPPTVLHFLLELDRQHRVNWGPRSDRLLLCQLRYHRMKTVGKKIRELTLAGQLDEGQEKALDNLRKTQPGLVQNWRLCRLELLQDKEYASAQLLSLAQLTQMDLSLADIKDLTEHSGNFEAEFVDTRRQALAGFFRTGGLVGLFKHHADASNRLHAVLSFELNSLLRKHELLDRLLKCSSEERDAIGKAAQTDLPILRQEWESIRNDLILRSRAKVLRSSSQKRARKPIGHLESSQTLVPATPKSGKPEQPRKPPSVWPARDLARRRVMRINHFIDELKEWTAHMDAQVKTLREEMIEDLRNWGKQAEFMPAKQEAILQRCIAFVSEAMLTQDSGFSDAMLELLRTLGEQKASLASGGAGQVGARLEKQAEDGQ